MVWARALLKVGCTIFMGTNEVYSFCLAMICLFFGVFISSCVVTLLVCWQHVFEAEFMQSFFSWYFQVKYRDLLRSTWHRPFQRTLLSLNPFMPSGSIWNQKIFVTFFAPYSAVVMIPQSIYPLLLDIGPQNALQQKNLAKMSYLAKQTKMKNYGQFF